MNKYQRLQKLFDKKIFFIVGASKSGTTWLQRLLDGHPAIRSAGEGHFMNHLAPNLTKTLLAYNKQSETRKERASLLGLNGDFPVFDADGLTLLLRTAILTIFDRWVDDIDAIEAIGEKTPEHANAMNELAKLFPASRFIHVLRDGRDVCLSGWHFSQKWSPEALKDTTLAQFVAHYAGAWRSRVTQAREFGDAHPGRLLEIRYEALHANPEAEVKRLLEFIQVASAPDIIASCLEAGSFEALSGGRIRGDEDQNSFFRKGIVGDHKEYFDNDAFAAFEKAAGPLLRELDYD